MRTIINALGKDTPLGRPLAVLVVVIALFAIAGVVEASSRRGSQPTSSTAAERRRRSHHRRGLRHRCDHRDPAAGDRDLSDRDERAVSRVRARAAVLDRRAVGRATAADDRRRVVPRDHHRLCGATVPDRRDRRSADVLRRLVPDRRHGRRRRVARAGSRRVRLAPLTAPPQRSRGRSCTSRTRR